MAIEQGWRPRRKASRIGTRDMPHRFELKKKRGAGMHYVPILAVAWPRFGFLHLRLGYSRSLGRAPVPTRFQQCRGDDATLLQNGINEYLDKIRATRAFYDSSKEVDFDEFTHFTDHHSHLSSRCASTDQPRSGRRKRLRFRSASAANGECSVETGRG